MNVGDEVLLKRDTFYYIQAPGVIGKVEEILKGIAEGWVRVEWYQESNGFRVKKDNYPLTTLIPATKLSKLLLGLDTEDNAVYNKAKDKT
jgi:hypothetical protein